MKYKKFEKVGYQTKLVDIFINTAFRHIARKAVYTLDNYITYLEKDLRSTSLRCQSCFKLCNYNFNNILYSCSHCRTTS